MDKERVKLIVKNMELLIDALKKEIDDDAIFEEGSIVLPYKDDYDEVFSE
jgi:hypothetical protein